MPSFLSLRLRASSVLAAALFVVSPLRAAEPMYGARLVQGPSLWSVAKGRGVKVAVIDTGIDPSHPALQAAYRGGYDFARNDATPNEEMPEAHGTAVASVVVQVAPEAGIYALKIFGNANSFRPSDLVRAIDWSIQNDMDVLNMSFALKSEFDTVSRAIDRAERSGIVVVAAAGNAGGPVDHPAAFTTPIAVGAIDATRQRAPFSNRGPQLDVAAPGVDVYSAAPRGQGLAFELVTASGVLHGTGFGGARSGDVAGTLVDCGTGRTDQIPATLRGNVALLRIDTTNFGDALGNVVRGGAIGIVAVSATPALFHTNVNPPGVIPPVISIGNDTAARLPLNESVRLVSTGSDYEFGWGTSLATPHVTGVVALLRELAPDATPSVIRTVLMMAADDAGPAGLDDEYGWGIVNAWSAAKLLVPEKLPSPRRRSTRH